MRRWVRLQEHLIRKSFDAEHVLKGPVPLIDFANRDDAADAARVDAGPKKGGWRISDDEVIGGFSRANLTVIRNRQEEDRVNKGLEPVPGSDSTNVDEDDNEAHENDNNNADDEDEEEDEEFLPFVRWKGTLDTRIGETSQAKRSGFCAIRSPEFVMGGARLGNRYNALEFLCRPDGRKYTVNLQVETSFPEDLYQNFITYDGPGGQSKNIVRAPQDPNGFTRVILPFRQFLLTSRGRLRENQRVLDGGIAIERIGLTLMDEQDGDFVFDLAKIRAINYVDGLILGEEDDEAPY